MSHDVARFRVCVRGQLSSRRESARNVKEKEANKKQRLARAAKSKGRLGYQAMETEGALGTRFKLTPKVRGFLRSPGVARACTLLFDFYKRVHVPTGSKVSDWRVECDCAGYGMTRGWRGSCECMFVSPSVRWRDVTLPWDTTGVVLGHRSGE